MTRKVQLKVSEEDKLARTLAKAVADGHIKVLPDSVWLLRALGDQDKDWTDIGMVAGTRDQVEVHLIERANGIATLLETTWGPDVRVVIKSRWSTAIDQQKSELLVRCTGNLEHISFMATPFMVEKLS